MSTQLQSQIIETPVESWSECDDAALLAEVRAGRREAYGTLYLRHQSQARGYARRLTNSAADAEDVVSEAFMRVLQAMRNGRGPRDGFRPYLLASVRNVAITRWTHAAKGGLVTMPDTEVATIPQIDVSEAVSETSALASAFETLPERWRQVLWLLECEELSIPEVAERLGLTPNALSALAYRARAGLRAAYLEAERADLAACG